MKALRRSVTSSASSSNSSSSPSSSSWIHLRSVLFVVASSSPAYCSSDRWVSLSSPLSLSLLFRDSALILVCLVFVSLDLGSKCCWNRIFWNLNSFIELNPVVEFSFTSFFCSDIELCTGSYGSGFWLLSFGGFGRLWASQQVVRQNGPDKEFDGITFDQIKLMEI